MTGQVPFGNPSRWGEMVDRSSSRWLRRLPGIGLALAFSILAGDWLVPAEPTRSPSAEAFWAAGVARPIAVRDGRATFRVATPGAASETLVVVSALARSPVSYPIRLVARPARRSEIPVLADDGRRGEVPARADAPPGDDPGGSVANPPMPPSVREFHIMVREGDPGSPSNYVPVRAVLRGLGRHVQVYVAGEDIPRVDRGALEDAIATFDDRVLPAARDRFGPARDVDGDGRFTILFSSWLDALGGGRHAVDGFVRVADLDAAVPAPFGNRCDMMYLNAGLQAGPYLRTIIAHEYMHAVVYTRKSLEHPRGDQPGPEEEGWLDEAMAHLVEESHGFSAANIDYRVGAYLSDPERYRLVVDDYFAADLFRSHGCRGCTYLFLRWCVERYGPDLLTRLAKSGCRGVPNIEAATGSSFASLFRRWSIAMFLDGLDGRDPSTSQGGGRNLIGFRGPVEDREFAGPRYRRVKPDGQPHRWDAAGTSCHYVLLQGDSGGAVEIEVEGPPEACIQVTALPLGAGHAQLGLEVKRQARPGVVPSIRARITEGHGVPVRLSSLSWEPLIPGPRPRVDGPHPGRLDMLGVASAFGTSALEAHGQLDSAEIPLEGVTAGSGPLAIKVVGTDAVGRRVNAWAELENTAPAVPAIP
ncbi:MAG: hypothetical protein ACYC61_17340 [Isosphaeraceae bacterium]